LLGCGITRLYELINSGELVSFKDGKSRKITTASIKAYIARQLQASTEDKMTAATYKEFVEKPEDDADLPNPERPRGGSCAAFRPSQPRACPNAAKKRQREP
jgi:hypothetical protein